jgi:hypothetical protein
VTPFGGVIDGAAAATAGAYAYAFDTDQTGSVTAAAGTARIDRLDVQLIDPAEGGVGGANPLIHIVRTDGTPGSGVPAAAPAQTHPLALINVPAGGGSPTVSWNATYYSSPGGFTPVRSLALLQGWTTAAEGQLADVIADSAPNNGQYRFHGSSWAPQRAARHHIEFSAGDGMVDANVRYPQWTLDSARTWDAPGSTVVAWNNGSSNPSGLQFNTVGIYAVQFTAVLAVNITSGTAVITAATGTTIEGNGTSGPGNQYLTATVPGYVVTSAGQQLSLWVAKTNGSPAGNIFRVRVDRIA